MVLLVYITMEESTNNIGILEGAISIASALRGNSREITTIYIAKGKQDPALTQIINAAKSQGIDLRLVDIDEITSMATGHSHGGVIAITGPRKFAPLDSLLPHDHVPWIVMLDGVEDPFNFGASVRSLYAAGADGLILRERNWMSAAATVARSSAGASELIPTATTESAEYAAEFFRKQGLSIVCANDEQDSVSLYDMDLTIPIFLLIGGEKRGITRGFRKQADVGLRVPYKRRDAHSLGTAAAAAVISFEIFRQRNARLK